MGSIYGAVQEDCLCDFDTPMTSAATATIAETTQPQRSGITSSADLAGDARPASLADKAGSANEPTVPASLAIGGTGLVTGTTMAEDVSAAKRVALPEHLPVLPPATRERYTLLQKWEGFVLALGRESFTARLADLTEREPDIEVEISLSEVTSSDRELVRTGAVFDWNIWYVDGPTGQRARSSVIRFRRMPAWRAEDLSAAKKRAERLRDVLGWK